MLSIHSTVSTTFDGSTEYVSMGDVLDKERTDAFSAWAWVKTTTTSDAIFGKRTTDANLRGWELGVNASGFIIIEIQSAVADRIEVTSDVAFNDGSWHLVAFTYDGSSTAAGTLIYVDGILVDQTANENTLASTISNTAALTVAARNASTTAAFAGQVDEPGFVDKELTAVEILELYNGGRPKNIQDLTFYTPDIRYNGGAWRGGDGSDTTATWFDATGKNNGTATGLATTNYTADVPFRDYLNILSMVFDGTDDWVDFGDVLDFERTDTFSIEFWFKTATAAVQALVAKGDVAATAGYEVSLDASGSVHFFAVNTPSTNELNVRTTATGFDDGAWHHCCVTYDGSSTPGGVNIYVDSTDEVLTTVTSSPLSASILNADPLRFGARSDGADRLTGNMTQVGIFSAVLSQAQVDELFDNGPVDKKQVSAWTNVVGHWHLGNCDTGSAGALTTTLDRSLGGNDGTTAGSPVVDADVPTGGVNQFGSLGVAFDGSSQYIDCGDVTNFQFERTDAFSLECWVKFPSSVSGSPVFMAKASGLTPFTGYWLFVNTSEQIVFQLINTTSTNVAEVRTNGTGGYNDNLWHHIAATYDGSSSNTGMSIYVDGTLPIQNLVSNSLSASILIAESLELGGVSSGGSFWLPGNLADCAVYDVELTHAQVAEHYNGGAPINRSTASTAANLVGWWPLGPGEDGASPTKVSDYSHNSHNHGTLSGTGAGLGQLAFEEQISGNVSSLSGNVSQDLITPATMQGKAIQQSLTQGSADRTLPFGTLGVLDLDSLLVGQPPGTIFYQVPEGGGGAGVTQYFLMRGVDDGTSTFTTWIVTDTPDPNGSQATGANTTPTLVGSIVAGSGVVVVAWQQ